MHKLVLAVAGCDHACTLIGCGNPLQVDLQRAAWTPGTYEITVIADGETSECTVILPLDCNAPSPCGDAPNLIIEREGCALPAPQHKIGAVAFTGDSAPAAVEVRVVQDGVLLGEAAYTPKYTESTPNGPNCGPACKSSDPVTLALK